MNTGRLALASLLLAVAGPATAVDFSPVVAKLAAEDLERGIDRYAKTRTEPSSLAETLKALGFDGASAAAILDRMPKGGACLEPRHTPDGRVILEDQGHALELVHPDPWTVLLKHGDRTFRWDWRKSTKDNLHRYDALFEPTKTTGFRWPSLFSSAWAEPPAANDSMYVLKASGLFFYFTVSLNGEIGGELYRLNDKVKAMLTLCRAPEPPQGQDDPFLRAVMQGTQDSQRFQGPIPKLHNCNDVRALTRAPVATVQGEPVFSRLPADLCQNLNELAVCAHQQMDPSSVVDGRIVKRPRDRDEWYDPSIPKPSAQQPVH